MCVDGICAVDCIFVTEVDGMCVVDGICAVDCIFVTEVDGMCVVDGGCVLYVVSVTIFFKHITLYDKFELF